MITFLPKMHHEHQNSLEVHCVSYTHNHQNILIWKTNTNNLNKKVNYKITVSNKNQREVTNI